MAEKKPGKRPSQKAKDEQEYCSTRLFEMDNVKLAQLAALRRESIAEAFHHVFGALLDTALINATEQRSAELRSETQR